MTEFTKCLYVMRNYVLFTELCETVSTTTWITNFDVKFDCGSTRLGALRSLKWNRIEWRCFWPRFIHGVDCKTSFIKPKTLLLWCLLGSCKKSQRKSIKGEGISLGNNLYLSQLKITTKFLPVIFFVRRPYVAVLGGGPKYLTEYFLQPSV